MSTSMGLEGLGPTIETPAPLLTRMVTRTGRTADSRPAFKYLPDRVNPGIVASLGRTGTSAHIVVTPVPVRSPLGLPVGLKPSRHCVAVQFSC